MGLEDNMNEHLYKLFIREMDPLLRYDINSNAELKQSESIL